MPNFGTLVFTPVIKELQERYGSRRSYARGDQASSPARLGPEEAEYIGERDSFYMATTGSTGWPYIQHRGGPVGFLKVIDQGTLAFADFRGNKQFISTGNLMTDDRVALILVDYPRQLRLKILGHAELREGTAATELLPQVADPNYGATVERVFVIKVAAFDWNCQQHITARYTAEQIQRALAPFEAEFARIQQENEQLRQRLGQTAEAG